MLGPPTGFPSNSVQEIELEQKGRGPAVTIHSGREGLGSSTPLGDGSGPFGPSTFKENHTIVLTANYYWLQMAEWLFWPKTSKEVMDR